MLPAGKWLVAQHLSAAHDHFIVSRVLCSSARCGTRRHAALDRASDSAGGAAAARPGSTMRGAGPRPRRRGGRARLRNGVDQQDRVQMP